MFHSKKSGDLFKIHWEKFDYLNNIPMFAAYIMNSRSPEEYKQNDFQVLD